MTAQSMSNTTEKLSEELQLCKEKISSLEEQNRQLDLQGSKVIKILLVAITDELWSFP